MNFMRLIGEALLHCRCCQNANEGPLYPEKPTSHQFLLLPHTSRLINLSLPTPARAKATISSATELIFVCICQRSEGHFSEPVIFQFVWSSPAGSGRVGCSFSRIKKEGKIRSELTRRLFYQQPIKRNSAEIPLYEQIIFNIPRISILFYSYSKNWSCKGGYQIS